MPKTRQQITSDYRERQEAKTGRKPRQYQVTDPEHDQIKALLKTLRAKG